MRVAFDHQIFTQRHGGISRYFARLAANLPSFGVSPRIFAGLHKNAYLSEISEMVSGSALPDFPPKLNRLVGLINQAWFTLECPRWKPNVIHETYFAPPCVSKRSVPIVTTVYDMIHELFPSNFKTGDTVSNLKKLAVEKADHVICISERTKLDLVRLWGTPERKLSVVYLACDPTGQAQAVESTGGSCVKSVQPGAGSKAGAFLLYVGDRRGYKNFQFFLKSVAGAPDLAYHFGIVAFGGGRFTAAEKYAIASLGYRENQVTHITGTDAELAHLYSSAAALVYPSIYEGFGLPPLEAMAHGCPVVSSNTSSMPEVLGDAAQFFDPTDLEAASNAIRIVVSKQEMRSRLVSAGFKRTRSFSWEKCAAETLNVYKSLI